MLALCAAKSGKIMAFKFPVLKPKTIDCSGLPVHDFKCLTNKEIIGKGAYGAVFTANWVVSSCTGTQRNETLTNASQLHVWI